jgi:hypothetical protein
MAGKREPIWVALNDRLNEVELILIEKGKRPPTRLGQSFRYLLENIETIKEIVEERKSTEHPSAT